MISPKFNIEFNPNCCMYLGIGSCLRNLVRLLPESRDVLCTQAERTSDGWTVTYGDNRTKIRNLCAILGREVFEMENSNKNIFSAGNTWLSAVFS